MALTMVATAAARIALAAASAERERRAARLARARDRHFGLIGDELPGRGLRRMALAQLDLAIELLAADNGKLSEAEATHETRKALKRIRTLVRLAEDQLGAQSAAREHAALRTAGRRLAGARDAQVAVATLDELMRRDRTLGRRAGVRRLHTRLTAQRDREARMSGGADPVARAAVLAQLRAARDRAGDWQLSDRGGVAAYTAPFERIYRKGRRRRKRAAAARSRKRTALMHRWRKSVKDLRYGAEALGRCDPVRLARGGRIAASLPRPGRRSPTGTQRDYLARLASNADSLAEHLGEEHDLAILAERVRADEQCGRATRRALLKAIKRRSRRLRRRSLREGARLFRHPAKRLGPRLRSAHSGGAPA